MDNMKKFASVKVQGIETPVTIPITSGDKPDIEDQIRNKWQNVIDVMAECLIVPAGLIMHLNENEISVFLSSKTDGNPYKAGESESLQHGLYCETVVGSDVRLLVPDAREDHFWKNNPDIKLGMVSYLGFPIKWPDGEIFGTICVLDSKKNSYSEKYIKLMEVLKNGIENDLSNLLSNYNELLNAYKKLETNMETLERSKKKLANTLSEKEILLSEIHHRVKNNMQIISSIVELQCSTSDEVLKKQFITIKNRIQAMGIVHEILYNSSNFRNLNMKHYIHKLVNCLDASLTGNDINYDYEILINDGLLMNLETAIPIGLIINEIVTNSIKHAFSGKNTGHITIKIHEQPNDVYLLQISDNGHGIPDKILKENKNGLGRTLIDLLVQQLNGTLDLSIKNGTTYSIILQKSQKEEKRWVEES